MNSVRANIIVLIIEIFYINLSGEYTYYVIRRGLTLTIDSFHEYIGNNWRKCISPVRVTILFKTLTLEEKINGDISQ